MSVRRSKEIAAYITSLEQEKATLPFFRTLLTALLGGIFIGFTVVLHGIISIAVTAGASDFILSGVVYSIGFIIIFFTGAQIFIGDFGMMAALDKKVPWAGVVKNWLIIFVGNLAGALIFMFIYLNTSAYNETMGDYFIVAADDKCKITDWVLPFMGGFLGSILICLAVWMYSAAENTSGKILLIMLPISALAICGFEYSIANMVIIPMGLSSLERVNSIPGGLSGELDLVNGILNNILPVTIGNLIGGTFIMGLIYWYVYKRN
ncbi:MAG: formate/nitrite transporter family protein [Promethearchaeota archaeon]